MGDLTYFPGATAARRHLSSPLASAEQRQAAADHLRDTCPEDLMWAEPGTMPTRRLTDAELVEIMPPEQWRATKVEGKGFSRFVNVATLVAVGLVGFVLGQLVTLAQVVGQL